MISRREMVAMSIIAGMCGRAAPAIAAAVPAAKIEWLDDRMAAHFARDTVVEHLGSGLKWAEGPTWDSRRNCLYLSDIPANILYRWDELEGIMPWRNPAGSGRAAAGVMPGTNGLCYREEDDMLLVCDQDSRSIIAYSLSDWVGQPVVRDADRPFNSPNDLVRGRDGALYFTDPPYGLTGSDASRAKTRKMNGVYRRNSDGSISLIDGDLSFPNGIGLSPSGQYLYVTVSDPADPRMVRYRLEGAAVTSRDDRWFDMRQFQRDGSPGMPDGMAIAEDGTLFVAAPGGVAIISADGVALGRIVTGAPTGNCCIAENAHALFITANDSLWRVRLRKSA